MYNGSDTSAVAGGSLNADRCDIYTDVDGVYTTTADYAESPQAGTGYIEEMLEMASAMSAADPFCGLAMRHNVNLQVLSSFSNEPGTLVIDEDDNMEKQKISGIAYSRDEAKVTLVSLPDRPGITATVFGSLAERHINVDMIASRLLLTNKTPI